MICHCGRYQVVINNMDMISVIVPAYNCQDTIERCIKSIQNQTYKNIEIIVINDGSTDGSEAVIKELQSQDERIKLISIPNGGVSHARNTGIDNADGDYITFVDSDDYIDEEMYQTLYNLIKEYDVEIAHCSYKNVDGDSAVAVGNIGKIYVQNHDEALKCLLSGRLFTGGNWNKVYSRSLFEDIRFDESIKINEDVLANYMLFDRVDRSVFTDKALYNYVANTNSATHAMRSNMGVEHVALVAEKMAEMSKGKSYQQEADYRCAFSLLVLYRGYFFSNNPEDKGKKEETRAKVKSMKDIYKGKDRINYCLLISFPFVYKPIYKFHTRFRKKKLDPTQ